MSDDLKNPNQPQPGSPWYRTPEEIEEEAARIRRRLLAHYTRQEAESAKTTASSSPDPEPK